jgi:ribose 5-phosphate isomerase B
MRLVVASDEQTPLTDEIVADLRHRGHELTLMGHLVADDQKWRWADIGKAAARLVASGEVEQGILFCWSGTGVCIAANKVRGMRAALCWSPVIAELARKWDDANVLCMSLKETAPAVARDILDAWFATAFDEEDLRQAHTVDE